MSNTIRVQDALDYHSEGRPGKIEVIPTKPTNTQRDLALAYSPGVAEPCLEIEKDVQNVYKYTAKGNLVAVISNGTAILGLGNLGPEASKPVMEGKGVLFKVFADIDVFDLEVDATDVDHFCSVVKALEPTFGGVNLEDIKAPECFEIERRLKAEMNIPVMHDDQHGTAIIVGAALLNALELVPKKIQDLKIVVSGAGASAVSCIKIIKSLGATPENFVVLDSKGVIRKDRTNLDSIKSEIATAKDFHTIEEAMKGADVFIGLSQADLVSQDMLRSMAENPIVFALANPNPEINYPDAIAARPDVIMATGRSDYPNQVNNVLGFPFIFRGALDVRATEINEEMKLAAVRAIAALAKLPVPDMVSTAYQSRNMEFGRDYLIPKPIDPRLIYTVSPAVAKAAMDSGVAQKPITDWDAYTEELKTRLGSENKLTKAIMNQAKQNPKRVIFAEADNVKILKAIQIAMDEKIIVPILLGNIDKIKTIAEENKIDLEGVQIIDPLQETSNLDKYGSILFDKRKRRGLTLSESSRLMRLRNYYGAAMLANNEGDAMISGLTRKYADVIKPALQIVGIKEEFSKVAGLYIMNTKRGNFFLADTTVNINPNAEDLVKITELTHSKVKSLGIEPVIAMLSFSNFGSSEAIETQIVSKATQLLKDKHPDWIIDGEVQANFAVNNGLLREHFGFSDLVNKKVNTLIFPNLSSGNIAYKLLQELGGFEAIGPILMGMKKPVHVLQLGSSVREIVNMISIAVSEAQNIPS